MRSAHILYKGEQAGILTQHDDGTFTFQYTDAWMKDSTKPGISLTLSKIDQVFHSQYLFPFFYHMLPEGANKQVVCRQMRIDEMDAFGLLITTAQFDTIGAVTFKSLQKPT